MLYWCFLEIGMAEVCHEEIWGTNNVMIETTAKAIAGGGIAALATEVLNGFFGDTFDIMRSGVSVKFPDGSRARIFAEVGCLLADEPALKDLLDFKGHAGTRCCFMCLNCVLHKAPADSLPLHLFSSYCSTIPETDIKNFKAHTDTTLKVAMWRLHAYKRGSYG